MTLCVTEFGEARPGQFVHLNPIEPDADSYPLFEWDSEKHLLQWMPTQHNPLLRRAFSIADLRRDGRLAYVDIIYRIVGTATTWLQSLSKGDSLSILGPLGNRFPLSKDRRSAWLVSGGVGLPPMLWLAGELRKSGKAVVAFCGAQSADLFPLTLNAGRPPSRDATSAEASAVELAVQDVPVVLSTDDGSLGFHGHVGKALCAYVEANPVDPSDVVVYTCGPEKMMHFVAEYCDQAGIPCWVCMERNMACGLGTCQSCPVPVEEKTDEEGWVYRLCCSDGPIFDGGTIRW